MTASSESGGTTGNDSGFMCPFKAKDQLNPQTSLEAIKGSIFSCTITEVSSLPDEKKAGPLKDTAAGTKL